MLLACNDPSTLRKRQTAPNHEKGIGGDLQTQYSLQLGQIRINATTKLSLDISPL